MSEITTSSGAKVIINAASFAEAKNLWNAVERVAATKSISPDILSFDGLMANIVMAIDSFPDFNNALWPCLIRCTRNDIKIEAKTFEDVEVRKEYYEIVAPCVEINIRPFAESLFSELHARLKALKKPNESPA